jgi:undecaprenyl-diphosphatase
MDALQILVLALVQGLTEYLPISSSAHLILAPRLFGFPDQGLAFDVAVHFGSLLAVIGYFRRDLRAILADWFVSLPRGAETTDNSRLGWAVIIGTVPVVIGGLLFKGLVETDLRSPQVIAAATIGFGLLLWRADRRARRYKGLDNLGLLDVLFIGVMQVLALIPGTSRSGITMTAGLMLGLTREAAARFSFLLAIPTILMSATLVTAELAMDPAPVDWRSLGFGVLLSWAAAYSCIHVFLRVIERMGMLPFVLYRLLLGVVIMVLVYLP